MSKGTPNPRSAFKESLANGDPEVLKRRFLALLDACQALSTSLVLEEVMDLICRGVNRAFGLTSVDIYEHRPERDEVVAVWSVVPGDPQMAADFVGTSYSLKEHPHIRRAFEPRRVNEYHIDDPELAKVDPTLHDELEAWGEKSVIEVGLLFGDELMGVLSVGSNDKILRLDDVERELMIAFASTAAIALHNARLYRRIEEQAIEDGLTGLYNHRYFVERLGAEIARSKRYGDPLALLMIDVDDFKRFNDHYGHLTGDDALRAVGAVLQGEMRRGVDVACRYGGDEFAVILPHATDSATDVAERVRQRIAAATFAAPGGGELGGVDVSVGVAAFPGSYEAADDLVRAADEALYEAKAQGKNRVVVAHKPEE
jgi:diguanylate cyclase (GGDEF)-like protein